MTPEEMYFGLKRFLTIPNPTAEFTKDQAIELLLDYSEMPLVGATCVCTRLENEGVEMVPATDPRVSEDQRTRATLILSKSMVVLPVRIYSD